MKKQIESNTNKRKTDRQGNAPMYSLGKIEDGFGSPRMEENIMQTSKPENALTSSPKSSGQRLTGTYTESGVFAVPSSIPWRSQDEDTHPRSSGLRGTMGQTKGLETFSSSQVGGGNGGVDERHGKGDKVASDVGRSAYEYGKGSEAEGLGTFSFSQVGGGKAVALECHEKDKDEKGDSDVGTVTYEYRKGREIEPRELHDKDNIEPSKVGHGTPLQSSAPQASCATENEGAANVEEDLPRRQEGVRGGSIGRDHASTHRLHTNIDAEQRELSELASSRVDTASTSSRQDSVTQDTMNSNGRVASQLRYNNTDEDFVREDVTVTTDRENYESSEVLYALGTSFSNSEVKTEGDRRGSTAETSDVSTTFPDGMAQGRFDYEKNELNASRHERCDVGHPRSKQADHVESKEGNTINNAIAGSEEIALSVNDHINTDVNVAISSPSGPASRGGQPSNFTVDDEEEKKRLVHDEMLSRLVARGAVEGILDLSKTESTKKVAVGTPVHDSPDKVLDFILCESSGFTNNFQRTTLYEYEDGKKQCRVVFWQLSINRGSSIVEFLINLAFPAHPTSNFRIEITSLHNNDLPENTLERLKRCQRFGSRKFQRARITAELEISPCTNGQSLLVLAGNLVAEKGKSDLFSISLSIDSIITVIEKQFHNPDVIDERARLHFVHEIMPNAPRLRNSEIRMLHDVRHLETALKRKGKRVKGTLKEDIDKFLWREEGKVWAGYEVTVDATAKEVLAGMFEFDSYSNTKLHNERGNKGMPLEVRKNVNGTRSLYYRKGIHMPRPFENRVFDSWWVWSETTLNNGESDYMVGCVPLNSTKRRGFKDISKEGFVAGDTTCLYIIREVAPNVCRVMRCQNANLNFKARTVPDAFIDSIAKTSLDEANKLQEKFRRNGKKVDEEVREVLAKKMKQGCELTDEQEQIFVRLMTLFEGVEGWKHLQSPYKGIEMEVKYHELNEGQGKIALGKAEVTADCTAEEAAAWYFEYCSRERMAIDREEGNPARIELKGVWQEKKNEKKFATIKEMPFPLDKRQFVFKQIWRKNGDNSLSIGVEPLPDIVDYGFSTKRTIRGEARVLFTVSNKANIGDVPQCKIELKQYIDMGGLVPKWVLDRKLPYAMSIVKDLLNTFKRDKDVDKAQIASLTNIIENEEQTYNEKEKKAIDNGKEFYMKGKEDNSFIELENPDTRVEMKLVHIDEDSLASGVATTIVNASVEECAAHIFYLDSRELKKTANEYYITDYNIEQVNQHTLYYSTTRDLSKFLSTRKSRSKMTWKKEEDGIVIIDVADAEEPAEDNLKNKGKIISSAHTVWVFKPMKPLGNLQQTAVTFTTKVDLGGAIPKSIMNSIAPQFLSTVSDLRKKLEKSKEIDAYRRLKIVERMKKIKKNCTINFDVAFVDIQGKEKVERAFHLSTTFLKIEGNGKGWGKTTVKVKAGLFETAAYFWDYESNAFLDATHNIKRVVEKKIDDWEVIVRRKQKLESAQIVRHRDRVFANRMKLHKISKDEIVITMESMTESTIVGPSDTELPASSGRAKVFEANEDTTIRFIKRGENETKVEFVTRLILGDGVSGETTRLAIDKHLEEAADVQRYFINLVKLENMTNEVGKILGAYMIWDDGQHRGQNNVKDREKYTEKICQENAALSEVVQKYPWFVAMLKKARLGNLSMNKTVKVKLECVEEKEAKVIGNNLMPCLKSRKMIAAGVDQWKLQNRAVGELFEEFQWMEGMFVELGKGVVKSAPWGLMFRVCFGALTSMIDLVTDVYVTYMFWSGGKIGYFKASVASLIASICLQLSVVVVQNRKLGFGRVLKEAVPVLIGFKPAVDAYRIASNAKQEKGQLIDHMAELAVMKGVEMFAESIPGVIIQLMAIIKSGSDTAAWISVVISALTTGYSSASLSYDFDTDPGNRQLTPHFYGYVPANPRKRSIVFLTLMIFGAGMLMIRCLTIVLLAMIGNLWVFIYIGIDLGLFITSKILRGDFWYWIPAGGATEIYTSLLARILAKIVSDFTSIVHFRHPYELGGFYWSFCFGLTIGSLPTVLFVYNKQGGIESVVSSSLKLLYIIIPSTLAVFIVFLLNINKKYRKSFVSMERGKDLGMRGFLETDNEEVKAQVFTRSRHLWNSIESEVQDWVEKSWSRWDDEKPTWLDESMKSRIPLEWIPSKEDKEYEKNRREKVSLRYSFLKKRRKTTISPVPRQSP